MRTAALLLALVAALCAIVPARDARAQTADPEVWAADGWVFALATLGNSIYLGGAFSYVGPTTGNGVALDPATGERTQGWPRFDGPVYCAVADGAGGWYVGGDFLRVGGVARERLAHLRADGSLAPFNPGVDGPVRAMALAGTRLVIGGAFANAGGAARPRIAAFDRATGLVASWVNAGADGEVRVLLNESGWIYAAGSFTTIGGQSRNRIARLHPASGSVNSWNPDANGEVRALVVAGSVVYAGGSFTSIGGQPRLRLSALDVGTGAATAWNPAPNGAVTALVADATALYAGGSFSTIAANSRAGLAHFDTATGLLGSWQVPLPGEYESMALVDSTLYIGGRFTDALDRRYHQIALRPTGPGGPPWGRVASGVVHVQALSGSRLFTGGAFNSIGGVERRTLAEIDRTTGEATAWNPGTNGLVWSILPIDTPAGRRVYVGGAFETFDGWSRRNLAADPIVWWEEPWDPAPDQPVYALGRMDTTLYVGGAFDTLGDSARSLIGAFGLTSGRLTPWNPVIEGSRVQELVTAGSRIDVGGMFSSVGGLPRSNVASIDATTGSPLPWSVATDPIVWALASSGSTLYVGGQSEVLGGQPRAYLGALDTGTSAVLPWNPGANDVLAELVIDGDLLYAGGSFTAIGGESRSGIAALDRATGIPTSWNPSIDGTVVRILPDGSTVYASGTFTRVGGQLQPNFAAIRPDGAAPVVQVLFPSGSDGLSTAGPAELSWVATDDLAVQNVDLWLSRTGPGGPWEALAEAAPNTGSFLWNVTGPNVPGPDAYLRVDARDWGGRIGSALSPAGFSIGADVVDVDPGAGALAFAFAAPTPNPVRSRGRLAFTLPARGPVRLVLYDVRGREVAVLVDGERAAGRHVATLEAAGLGAGLYFARLTADHGELSRRVVVAP